MAIPNPVCSACPLTKASSTGWGSIIPEWSPLPPVLRRRPPGLIVGGNIGKNKITPNDQAESDYIQCFNALYDYVDYFVVNVSSPNTPGLRELQEKEPLQRLLENLMAERSKRSIARPIFLKIAPDLTDEQLNDIVELVQAAGIDGVIATNTTISREGLSTPAEEVEQWERAD